MKEISNRDFEKYLERVSQNPLLTERKTGCFNEAVCRQNCLKMTARISKKEGGRVVPAVKKAGEITADEEDDFICHTADCICPHGVSFADRQAAMFLGKGGEAAVAANIAKFLVNQVQEEANAFRST